jgi:alkylhydroperoxidase/carboxymuconolactone decarboxylase family protein YurZ
MQQKPTYAAILESQDHKHLERVAQVRDATLTDGALSTKVKTLMMMLCDSLLSHPQGVETIAGRARGLGATEEEIAETLHVAFLMGGLPALVTGCNAFDK